MKLLLVVLGTVLMAGTARAQCGKLVLNPLTGLFDCIGSSSGGGGTGSAAATHSVSFSATPTLTGTSATAGTVDTFIVGQLSANITGVTIATLTPGQVINIDFQQATSGGPYTVTYGASFIGSCAVSPFPSSHTKSTWYISAGPTATLTAGGCNADSGPNYSATLARSGIATPASGVAQGTDSSSNIPFSLDTAGVFRTEVKELTGIRQGNGANADDTAATQNQLSAPGYVAGGGSANAQTATLSPAVSTCSAGMTVRWKPTAANTTTTPTLAVGSCAAATIVKSPGNAALAANDLTTSAVATAVFDGTNWELQNPQTASGGGTSSHFIYVPFAAVTGGVNYSTADETATNHLATFSTSSNGIGLAQFTNAQDTYVQFPLILPSTWTGAAPTMVVDTIVQSAASGTYTLTPRSLCISNGNDIATVAYNAGTPVATTPPASGASFYYEAVTVTFPTTGCSAGQTMFFEITRSSTDTTTGNNVYARGGSLALVY